MHMHSARFSRCLVALLVLGGCATNPVTGSREFVLMTEAQEIAMGREVDGEVRREITAHGGEHGGLGDGTGVARERVLAGSQ